MLPVSPRILRRSTYQPARRMAALLFPLAVCAILPAQNTPHAPIPESNSSFIDGSGTAHITRVVPVPTTVSPAARHYIARPVADVVTHPPIAQVRANAAAAQNGFALETHATYPVTMVSKTIGGVPVRDITPPDIPENKRDRVLINIHGGGFTGDWGSQSESIPIASLTHTRVVAVLYRLSPENKFPAAVDDTTAVYKELLKTYKPQNIALYGTSAGAILTAETAVKVHQLALPLPAVLGIFSGLGDFSQKGDTASIYGLFGLAGPLWPESSNTYTGATDTKDPVLSPIYADLHGFPPTLFLSSTRDFLLSGTALLHRAFLRDGVDAQLVVFEGLNHAFWNDPSLPESKETYNIIATFFDKHLGSALVAGK